MLNIKIILYILILTFFLSCTSEPKKANTIGHNSPAIVTNSGNISVIYSKKLEEKYKKYIQNGKNSFHKKFNSTLAKYFYAKAIEVSTNPTDEEYAKNLYFSIPIIAKNIKIKYKYQKGIFNKNATKILLLNQKNIKIFNLLTEKFSLSIKQDEKCTGAIFSSNKIITWSTSYIYIWNNNGKLIKKIKFNIGQFGSVIYNDNILIARNRRNNITIYNLKKDIINKTVLSNIEKLLKKDNINQEIYLNEDIRFFQKDIVLIKFLMNPKYRNSHPKTNSILYDFKKNKIVKKWINNKDIYIANNNKLFALLKEGYTGLENVKIGFLKNDTEYIFDKDIKKFPNFNTNNQSVLFTYFAIFDKNYKPIIGYDISYINNLDKVAYSFFRKNHSNDILFKKNTISILDKKGFYIEYILENEKNMHINKEDYLLKMKINTGYEMTTSGDLIKIEESRLKKLKEKYILKYGKLSL